MKLRRITDRKESIFKIRKQGLEDTFFVMVVMFAVAITIIILAKVWTDIRDPLETGIQSALPTDTGEFNLTDTLDTTGETTLMFDKLFPFILIGLIGFVMIGASLMFQHPIMLFVGIIVLGVAIILAVAYSNIFHQISQTDEFSSTTDSFAITDIFMKYLPVIVVILFIIIGAVLWGRGKSAGGGGY